MKLFLSSTYEDLKGHRQKLEESFAISGIVYNAMEHFGSTTTPPLQTCLSAVRSSDGFIAVLGVRYGAAPPRSRRSFTEREYRYARTLGIPTLVFLIDMRNALVAPNWIHNETADQQRRLQAFKDLIGQHHHTVTYFTSPEDLSRLVLASVIREFAEIP